MAFAGQYRGCRGCWVSWLPLATLFQALEKKGISHLDEKDLKERNKRIQEDNRLELQKVGSDISSIPQSDKRTLWTAQFSQLLTWKSPCCSHWGWW